MAVVILCFLTCNKVSELCPTMFLNSVCLAEDDQVLTYITPLVYSRGWSLTAQSRMNDCFLVSNYLPWQKFKRTLASSAPSRFLTGTDRRVNALNYYSKLMMT
ncbi:hypothetical protein D5086_023640 [Populus alba]|uniref:Uncharacterized protein n=1 Tax=Populus alba TaxID=43335 RepID=A0ACC4BAU7_POPAL